MRYRVEFLRACRMTVAVVFLLAVLEVGVPMLTGSEMTVDAGALLGAMIATTFLCQIVFTAMNILNTKYREKREKK